MIAQLTKTGRVQYRGIERKVLANMTGDELAAELQRVERELREWRMQCAGQPKWYRAIPEIRAAHNVLNSERRRIGAELRQRGARLNGYNEWVMAEAPNG